MELTNPINNQHMVDGLNRVICSSRQLQLDCDRIVNERNDVEAAKTLTSLKEMHTRHIEMLSDSVRFLGGAPEEGLPTRKFFQLKKQAASLNELYQEERELIKSCEREIKHLTGSDEVAEKLLKVKDDINRKLDQ